jgi:hypothetical protein
LWIKLWVEKGAFFSDKNLVRYKQKQLNGHMPNRLLRDGICTSELINMLSPEEEVMFYRLLVVCDDYGYADARPAILKAQCFPLKESVKPADIERWLTAIAGKALIARYRHGDKPYLAVSKWEQRVRSRQKYPGPTDDGCQAVDGHMSDSGPTSVGLGKGKGKGKGATSREVRELRPLPDDWSPSSRTTEGLSREFGLVPEDVPRYVAAFRDVCRAKDYRYKDFDAAFANCVRQDWPKFRVGRQTAQTIKVDL